jgi:MinD-like ATPase involved in chromosome partitioning or flagellar assembly
VGKITIIIESANLSTDILNTILKQDICLEDIIIEEAVGYGYGEAKVRVYVVPADEAD